MLLNPGKMMRNAQLILVTAKACLDVDERLFLVFKQKRTHSFCLAHKHTGDIFQTLSTVGETAKESS